MAYGNSYGGYARQSNYQPRQGGNTGTYSRPQAPAKEPFDLDKYIDDYIDVYNVFKAKLDNAGIELPPDTIARWVTSAKISMDK